jgi:hypothetical protein
LLASGVAPLNPTNTDPTQAEGDGGGGGGAGGTVVLNTTSITGAITVQAQGANGSNSSNLVNDCTGPGGGGGGGVIWTAGGSIPAAISASVTGGSNGVVSAGNTKVACRGLANGAMAGGTGIGQAGYVIPESAANTCVPLALSLLKYFTGVPVDQYIRLTWGLNSPSAASTIQSFTLERSTDQLNFTDVTTIAASMDSVTYRYTDNTTIGATLFYRLVWLNNDGQPSYSQILAFDRPLDPSIAMIRLEPNPVSDQLSVNLFSTRQEMASLRLFAAQGQLLTSNPISLQVGMTSVVLPVSDLPAATYFLVVETKERREVKPFIKK